MNPKQLARVSLFHLKEATLSVLLKAKHENGEPLPTRELRERLGIPKAKDEGRPPGNRDESFMWGILLHLENEGRIVCSQNPENDKYEWKITDDEATLLSELSDDNL